MMKVSGVSDEKGVHKMVAAGCQVADENGCRIVGVVSGS